MRLTLTDEEELEHRQENFKKIGPNTLFSFYTVSGTEAKERYCIAVNPLKNRTWNVIELTSENREKISVGRMCFTTRISFEEMNCLNILLP